MNRINPHTTQFLRDVIVYGSVYGGGLAFAGICIAGAWAGWRLRKRRDY